MSKKRCIYTNFTIFLSRLSREIAELRFIFRGRVFLFRVGFLIYNSLIPHSGNPYARPPSSEAESKGSARRGRPVSASPEDAVANGWRFVSPDYARFGRAPPTEINGGETRNPASLAG